jgi:hypothetical protein
MRICRAQPVRSSRARGSKKAAEIDTNAHGTTHGSTRASQDGPIWSLLALVIRVRDEEVAGSNPVTPTKINGLVRGSVSSPTTRPLGAATAAAAIDMTTDAAIVAVPLLLADLGVEALASQFGAVNPEHISPTPERLRAGQERDAGW